MKTPFQTVLPAAFALAFLSLAGPSRAADFTGKWNATFDASVGPSKYTYDLKQDGNQITGKATRVSDTDTNATDLAEGKVDGGTISFVEPLKVGTQDIRIGYKGKLSPTNADELVLTRTVGDFGGDDIVAHRQAAALVTGKWDAEFDTQIGHVKYTYDLTQDAGKLSGKAIRNQDDQKTETVITNGTVTGDAISFVEPLTIAGQDQTITITYTGKLAGDEIKFNRAVTDFATNDITAKRQK
jgi:hypothetical protein